MTIKPLVRLMSALGIVTLVAAACGDDDDAAVASTTSTTPVTTTTLTPPTLTTSGSTTAPSNGSIVASDGDLVSLHYTGTLDDGTVFDSSLDRAPLDFVVGSGQVISGFDANVRGLAVGDTATFRLEPAEAYGETNLALVLELSSEGAPTNLSVGDQVTLSNGAQVVVLEIGADTITVDANHRLAGQALTFSIEVVTIER